MPIPSLKLERIDGHTLLKVLQGVVGPVSIKVLVELPTEAGHEPDLMEVHCNHNCIPRLELMISTLAEKGDLALPLFSLALGDSSIYSILGMGKLDEISAPEIDQQEWGQLTSVAKQQLVLKEIKTQTLYSVTKLASRLKVSRSHLSNVVNGKRELSRKTLERITKTFSLNPKMLALIRSIK